MGQGSGRIVAGLDVHKRSTRIAAVRGDQLCREVTVASDPPIVEADRLPEVYVNPYYLEDLKRRVSVARVGGTPVRCDGDATRLFADREDCSGAVHGGDQGHIFAAIPLSVLPDAGSSQFAQITLV